MVVIEEVFSEPSPVKDPTEDESLKYCQDLKKQGNDQVAKQDWKMAFYLYSKGLHHAEENCQPSEETNEIKSLLLSNRALVQMKLDQTLPALEDCTKAIKLNSKNVKAYYRAGEACLKLKFVDRAKNFAVDGLEIDKDNVALKSLLKQIDGKKSW